MTISNYAWLNSPITVLLNIHIPLIQAPMAGGISTPALVAAVANAGGLGSLGAGYMHSEEIKNTIKEIKENTKGMFAVSLFIPNEHTATTEKMERARITVQASCNELGIQIDTAKPPYAPNFDEQIEAILSEDVPIFSFAFGVLSKNWIKAFKRKGVILIGTATNLEEAKILEDSNIDIIVAQGIEAGGHRGGFVNRNDQKQLDTFPLVKLLAANIKTPIIAAGGIMDSQGILSSFKDGAAAVQMGTAFLCSDESGAHPIYKKALLTSKPGSTVLTRAFSGKFARGLNNKFIERMIVHERAILEYPIQNKLTQMMRKEAAKQNNIDFMSMWAGSSCYLCKELPAAKIIEELNNELI